MKTILKQRAGMNRSLVLGKAEQLRLAKTLVSAKQVSGGQDITDKLINARLEDVVEKLPGGFVDLMFLDPPYNIEKDFNGRRFRKLDSEDYIDYVDSWLSQLVRLLKPNASIYICSDWRCSAAVQIVAEKYLSIRNRITWEREKGRGAKSNWKNCSEDILFCTVGKEYKFNVDAVKLKRKVLAPYKVDGRPKDWNDDKDGKFRLTHPSNLWTDITVPFWSMSENTDHPTQKPEKLLAKVILASSNEGDVVLDPFAGSGTTAVVAKKLGRKFVGIEVDETYCCYAAKRLELAEEDKSIQGYENGVFWERNAKKF